MGLMKTLTITEAKKNLGKWLTAAARGEDVGIIAGGVILQVKPVEVRPVAPLEIHRMDYEYARREYGVTKSEYDRFIKRLDDEYAEAKRAGTLVTIENPTFEKLEKAISNHAGVSKAARGTRAARPQRRVARAA